MEARTGDHPRVGRLLWNWFHHTFPDYGLILADQPDFQAIRRAPNPRHVIWGDIGMISPQAFAWALLGARPDDMWISILDGGFRHVVISILGQFVSRIPNAKAPPAQWGRRLARTTPLPAQHMPVEEQKRVERLILRRGRNTLPNRQVRQKCLGIFAVQFVRWFAP